MVRGKRGEAGNRSETTDIWSIKCLNVFRASSRSSWVGEVPELADQNGEHGCFTRPCLESLLGAVRSEWSQLGPFNCTPSPLPRFPSLYSRPSLSVCLPSFLSLSPHLSPLIPLSLPLLSFFSRSFSVVRKPLEEAAQTADPKAVKHSKPYWHLPKDGEETWCVCRCVAVERPTRETSKLVAGLSIGSGRIGAHEGF